MLDQAPLYHVAADDDGVCWCLADAGGETPVGLPRTALRRAASLRPAPAAADGFGARITADNFSKITSMQIERDISRAHRGGPPAGAVTFLDRRTLRTTRHNVTVHPYDRPARQRTAEEFRRDLAELRNGPPLLREELERRWRRVSDQRFGAFAGPDDTEFRQLPLKVALTRLSDPGEMMSVPVAVAGAGIDRPSARDRAMGRALAAYGSLVVDPRLLVDGDGAFLGPAEGDPAGLLGLVRDGSVAAFVRTIDLTDGRIRLVSARDAFPVLRAAEPFDVPGGTSAGLGWLQALTHGLLQQCARLTVAGWSAQECGSAGAALAQRPGPARPAIGRAALAVEDFDQQAGLRFLAAMVKAAGLGLTLRDITGPAGVPVVACASALGETVYGAGAGLADAVREALTGALFGYQRRRDPALRAALPTETPALWTSPASSDSLQPERLVRALANLGYAPSVFALDHDRAVHEAFPYVLRVVLTALPGRAGGRRSPSRSAA